MIELPPKDCEVEVCLIGTGGGYGESIILKVSTNEWIIIDSCINPDTSYPLALEYLEKINVDFSNVVLIICTHWHDDHIRGMSKVLQNCINAKFCISAVNDLKNFLYFLELDYTKSKKGSIRSTKEFANCLEILNLRSASFVKAQSNLLISSSKDDNVKFKLFALSPSDGTIINFDKQIGTLITEFGKSNLAVVHKTPNENSVALMLMFNDERVILGSDLEIGNDETEGWRNIIRHSLVLDEKKAMIYKVPHHGSKNGYLPEIFEKIIHEDPILKISPWNRNKKLPEIDMLHSYINHSDNIYLTSKNISNTKPKKRDKTIEKLISRFSISLVEAKYSKGIIRSRIDYKDLNAKWETSIFDSAIKL